MKVTKSPSEKTETGVFIGIFQGVYFPMANGSGWAFVDGNGKARYVSQLPSEPQIPVVQGEAVTLQF